MAKEPTSKTRRPGAPAAKASPGGDPGAPEAREAPSPADAPAAEAAAMAPSGGQESVPEPPPVEFWTAILDNRLILTGWDMSNSVSEDRKAGIRVGPRVPMPETAKLEIGRVIWSPDRSRWTPKPWVALLGPDGLLIGYDQTGDRDGVPVPPNCDLAIGRYRYNARAGRFDAVEPEAAHIDELLHLDAVAALTMGMIALRDGKPLPEYTLEYLRKFEKMSSDGVGLKRLMDAPRKGKPDDAA